MYLQQDEDQEVENLALARLKQAASKNNKTNVDNNGVHSANLVSLTGSPGLKDRKLSGGNRSDMEVSDDEASEVRDTFLDTESYPPPVRPGPGGLLSPWENGRPPQHAGPPPARTGSRPRPRPCSCPGPGSTAVRTTIQHFTTPSDLHHSCLPPGTRRTTRPPCLP